MDVWVERELSACEFPDHRLKARLGKILDQLGHTIGGTLPSACQDWAATKAAYRFFSNSRVNESIILAGHFAATRARLAAAKGPILILHDTTALSFTRCQPDLIGKTTVLDSRPYRAPTTLCGLLMHSSLAVTTQGKPLGLTAIKFWTRKQFKGTNALKSKINPTRVSIEQKESIRWLENLTQSTELTNPDRCIHIGDRESDIYELFCLAKKLGTHFLVRTCVNRVAGAGSTTIAKKMQRQPIRGRHDIEVFDSQRRPVNAQLQVRFCQMTVHPPIGKNKRYPPLTLTVIHAWERGKPKGRKPVHWKLLTDLPVEDLSDAIEKLNWYAQRWKIETFHKILKSGCRAEDAKLRTAERLTNLIAVFCIVAWRVFWLTMVNRTNPSSAADTVFTTTEVEILDRLVGDAKSPRKRRLTFYITLVGKLGGYLARRGDSPPGNMVLWRGLSRLTDIQLGFELHRCVVGN